MTVFNTRTWLLWLAAAMLYCMLTYNPVYQLLLFSTLLSITIKFRLPMKSYLKAVLLMSLIPLLVNTFLVHSGNTTVYEIPAKIILFGRNVPVLLIGGPLTLESLLTGFITALFLLNMLTSFQIFNSLTTTDSIMGIIPSALPNLSMTASITLRFIPTIIEDYNSIRDAQVSRGVSMDRGSQIERMRNQLAIIVPSIITSLERAFNMAESMAARGYSSRRTPRKHEKATKADAILSVLYALSVLLILYNSFSGVMKYWPYDSLSLPQLSVAALLPLLLIAIPSFLKNEHNTKG